MQNACGRNLIDAIHSVRKQAKSECLQCVDDDGRDSQATPLIPLVEGDGKEWSQNKSCSCWQPLSSDLILSTQKGQT